MATFGTIISDVQAIVIDTPAATQALVPKFINDAMRKAQDRGYFKPMEAEALFTTTQGSRELGPLPSDWKEPRGRPWRQEELGGTRELGYATTTGQALRRYNLDTEGSPAILVDDDTSLNVWPLPDGLSDYADGEYRVIVPYWRYLPPLVASGDSNFFTTVGETYLRYEAVGMAFMMNENDNRAALWLAQAEGAWIAALSRPAKYRAVAGADTLVPIRGGRRPGFTR